MPIDSRAYAWCNLGPLAPGGSSVAESHVQGSGVITYRGTVNLTGVVRPSPGAVVELAYSDGQNWIARLPVRLRVLSSFSNPLGSSKTTAVSVGCDLAYFEDRKQPPDVLTARDANPSTPEAVWRAAAPAIPAAWLVEQILTALGITAAGSIPLTNYYTREKFEFTAGYVEELGKLATSERYAVRMNPAGLLEFIYKDPDDLGASVILSEEDLIDLNPINSGTLPGDAVYARFTSLSLKAPESSALTEEGTQKRNWEREETISPYTVHFHRWTEHVRVPQLDGNGQPVYKQAKNQWGYPLYYVDGRLVTGQGLNNQQLTEGRVMVPVFEVKAYEWEERIGYIAYSTTRTDYDKKDRAIRRRSWTNDLWGQSYTETVFTYRDYYKPAQQINAKINETDYGELIKETTYEWSTLAPVKMSLGMQANYITVRGGLFGDQYQSGIRETVYEKDQASGITKTTTTSFVPFMQTPDGAETISRLRENRQPWDGVNDLLAVATRLVCAGSEVRIRTEREFGLQRRPSEAERSTTANEKTPAVEQQTSTTWAVGSATSQTQVELSPPYVPDDRIIESAGSYSVVRSDADQKALAYARCENRLLLGHRNGDGLQVLPEVLPPAPLGLVYIRLNGATAAFRVNGTTWNIDPEGVTATTDALFWGAIDGAAANAWFPLPPGVASLPGLSAVTVNANPKPANAIAIPSGFSFTAPNLSSLFGSLPTAAAPVYAKTITPGVLLRPYHETITLSVGSGSGVIVNPQTWIPQTGSLLAGSGSGVVADLEQLLAGTLSGVVIDVAVLSRSIAWTSDASAFTPGVASILVPAQTGVAWASGASTFTPGPRNGLIASNSAAITIPASGTATPYPSTITISDGLGLIVDKLTVTISGFSHSYVSDAAMLLVGPTGARSTLMVGVGGSSNVSGLTITFDQSAASAVTGTTSGTFRPSGTGTSSTFPSPAPSGANTATLANFADTQVFGTWSLYVFDTASPDGGSISGGWSLLIGYKSDPSAVSNGGAAWVGDASTFAPGAAVVVTPADTGVAWVSGASTFAPGVSDASFAQVQLLVHGDGANNATTFTDVSGAARALTANGNIKISTDQSKFGGSSIYCDGTGDFLSFTAISIGTSDNCTLEAWIYPTSTADRAIFGQSQSAWNMQPLSLLSGRLSVYWDGTQLDGSTVTANTWTHVALTRSGGILRLFQNGTLTATSGSNTAPVQLDRLGRGQYRGDFIGWIDDARVTVGTARYTASFTAPVLPFPDQ